MTLIVQTPLGFHAATDYATRELVAEVGKSSTSMVSSFFHNWEAINWTYTSRGRSTCRLLGVINIIAFQ